MNTIKNFGIANNLYKSFYNNIFKEIQKPLGRWAIDKCEKKINVTNYYSNIDHCGDCFYNKNEIDKIIKNVEIDEVILKTFEKKTK